MKCFDDIQLKKITRKKNPPTCQIGLKDRSYSSLDSQVDFHVSFRQGPSPHSIHRFWESTQIFKNLLIRLILQMFTGNYRDSTGKSECRDFKFMGIACIPAIPVILKFHTLISIVIFAGNLILQGYYGDSLH